MKNFNDELNNLMSMAESELKEEKVSSVSNIDEGFYDRVRMPKRYRGVTFETHPNKATERVKQFCIKKGGGLLLIIGPLGTGKTETACCSFVERVNNGLPAGEYLNVKYELGPMFRSTRLSNSPQTEWQFFEHLYKLPFLVLDELGHCEDQEIEKRVVTSILSASYDNDTKVIGTTNMTMQQFCDFMGDRMKDRFRQNAEVIVLDGKSWR